MRPWPFVLLIIGVLAVAAIVAAYGVRDITAAFLAAGWGIAVVAAFHAVPLAFDALGWRLLIDRPDRPGGATLYAIRWASESVNNLLPVAQVGGEIVRSRLAARMGVPGDLAGASVLVDVTLGLITQILFALVGLAALLAVTGPDRGTFAVASALLAFAAIIAAFFFMQRGGMVAWLGRHAVPIGRRLGLNRLESMAGPVHRLDNSLHALYRQRPRLAAAAACRMGSWLIGAFEVWLALHYMGHDIGLAAALAIHSLTAAARSAAFAVPGGVGAQEAGFLALGALVGLSGAEALALALIRRAREILFGLPGLVLWSLLEGRGAVSQARPEA